MMRIKTNEHRLMARSSFLTLTLGILFILSYLPVPREIRPTTSRSIASAAVQSILPKKHPRIVAVSMRAQAVYSTSILAQRRPHNPKESLPQAGKSVCPLVNACQNAFELVYTRVQRRFMDMARPRRGHRATPFPDGRTTVNAAKRPMPTHRSRTHRLSQSVLR